MIIFSLSPRLKSSLFLTMLLALVAAFIWTPIGNLIPRSSIQAPPPSTLRLSIASDPIHLEPALAGDSISGFVLRLIGEGLTRLNHTAVAEPALATEWSVSEDGRQYIFKLRKAFWSDGSPITARDFVHAWRHMLDPNTASMNAYLLFPLQHAKLIKLGQMGPSALGACALDEQTLQVYLEEPTPHFLQLLAFDAFFPQCPTQAEDRTLGGYGCGPFKITSWKPKNEMLFEKNPHYWDAAQVKMDRIELQVICDAQTALHLFEQGNLDWIGSPLSPLPNEAVEALSEKGQLHSYSPSSTYWVHCNLKHPLLQHLAARQALSMAIDRRRLAILLGSQYTAATGILPPMISNDLPNCPIPSQLIFDPATARKLWNDLKNELGYDPSTLKLIYLYNSSGMSNLHSKVAQLLQSQWREHLGIEVELRGLEWSVFLDRARRGKFDLARFGWPAQFSDATTFLDIFDTQDNGYNFSRFTDTRFSEALQRAHQSCDSLNRGVALVDAHKILLEQLPVIPLFFGSHTYLKDPRLKNVITGPLGRLDFKIAYWENSKNQ